jgi:hypothetical protein
MSMHLQQASSGTLIERLQATGAGEEQPTSGSSGLQGVPVYVMLPLDTVDGKGVFRYANATWFHQSLEQLQMSGIRGVAVDVWVRDRATKSAACMSVQCMVR